MPTFILPPDPAVITGQREPGERAIPRKHGSLDKDNDVSKPIELNERANQPVDQGQIHDEMIARKVFSKPKRSSMDTPKNEKRGHPSRSTFYLPAHSSSLPSRPLANVGLSASTGLPRAP
jgi:hypothetical protein